MSGRFELTNEPIDSGALGREVATAHDGAVASFAGIVRNHNDGLPVDALSYSAYQELAVAEGSAIVAEARERFDVGKVVCVHRVGDLKVGDVAVVVAVAAAHRGPAFDACRYVIDEVKRRVPVWKKEWAEGGGHWIHPTEENHGNT